MRTATTILFLLMACLTVRAPSALAGHPFGIPFDLNAGASLQLGDAELVAGFTGVSSDSRCPAGVWCFWEGDAATDLWIQAAGQARLDFVLHTASSLDHEVDLAGYTITLLEVRPYPVEGVPIEPGAYVATLVIRQGPVEDPERSWGSIKALYR